MAPNKSNRLRRHAVAGSALLASLGLSQGANVVASNAPPRQVRAVRHRQLPPDVVPSSGTTSIEGLSPHWWEQNDVQRHRATTTTPLLIAPPPPPPRSNSLSALKLIAGLGAGAATAGAGRAIHKKRKNPQLFNLYEDSELFDLYRPESPPFSETITPETFSMSSPRPSSRTIREALNRTTTPPDFRVTYTPPVSPRVTLLSPRARSASPPRRAQTVSSSRSSSSTPSVSSSSIPPTSTQASDESSSWDAANPDWIYVSGRKVPSAPLVWRKKTVSTPR